MKRISLLCCGLGVALLLQAGCGSDSAPLSKNEEANFNRPLTPAEKVKWEESVREAQKKGQSQ